MAGFRINLFRGIRPRISARKLRDGEAQTAENARLGSGDLEPWAGKELVQAISQAFFNNTIYLYDNGTGSPLWLEFLDVVDIARGPIKDDSLDRIYYTGVSAGTGAPRMTYTTLADEGGGGPYPENFRYLGVPAPVNPPSVVSTDLPEDLPSDERVITRIECDAFVIDEVYFTTYPGTGTDDDIWRLDTGAAGSIAFDFAAGTSYKVIEVVDNDKVVLESADNPGTFIRTTNADKTTVNDWKPMAETGSTKEADFLGWRVPSATCTITAHRLREGDVITITSAPTATGRVEYFPALTEDFYEQSWGTPEQVYEDGSSHYEVRDARVSASATEGSSVFTLNAGETRYEVDRAASEVAILDDRSYVYTYVTDLGEEGPPSPPSNLVLALDGDSVQVNALKPYLKPDFQKRGITQGRIYRTNSTEAGTEYQFVKEFDFSGAATIYEVDNVANEDLGELLGTTTWFPPDADMDGIISMPNGMMVGWNGKTVYFCEPYFPHAWPPEYDQAIDYDIVGAAAIGQSVVLLTTGYPYLVTGSHPRNSNVRPYKINQACVSKASIATEGDNVYYASPDGLVEISTTGARLVTEGFMDKEDWQLYEPSTMAGAFHDGRYFGFFGAEFTSPVTVTIGGSILTASPSDIVAGGVTITLTLTGDTWVDGGDFLSARGGLANAFDPIPDDNSRGWLDEVEPNIDDGDVVRTSATVVTITLDAMPDYAPFQTEVFTAKIPANALASTTTPIISSNSFTIAPPTSFTSTIMVFADDNSSADNGDVFVSQNDISSFVKYTPIDAGEDVRFNDVAYSPSLGRWVAVGEKTAWDKGCAFVSNDDGATWSEVDLDRAGQYDGMKKVFRSETHGLFLAIADDTPDYIEYSTDGITWGSFVAPVAAETGTVLAGLAYGGNYIYTSKPVAGGSDGHLLRSADLTVSPITAGWTAIDHGFATAAQYIIDLASGQGRTIALGSSGNEICYIGHGENTMTDIGALPTITGAERIAYGNDIWVVVNSGFDVAICPSGDDPTVIANWDYYAARDDGGTGNIDVTDIWYDKGSDGTNGYGFCVVGRNTTDNTGEFYTSADGITWTLRHTFAATAYPRGGGGKYEPFGTDLDA